MKLLKILALGNRQVEEGRVHSAKEAIASLRKFDQHGEWHYFPLIARGGRL